MKINVETIKRLLLYFRNFGVSALIDLSVFQIILYFTRPMIGDSSIILANVLARIISSLVNFSLNHNLFAGKSLNKKRTIIKYYCLWFVLILSSTSSIYFLKDILNFDEIVVKILSDSVLGIISYQVQRKWVFAVERNIYKKGMYFKIVRFVAKIFVKRKVKFDDKLFEKEMVFIGHHQNFYGPISCLIYLPDTVHFWVIAHLFDFKLCFKMYYKYTFRKTIKIPKIFAAIISGIISLLLPPLLRSARAIPVYRSSKSIVKTFDYSEDILKMGKQIIIYPDIDYGNKGKLMGEVYDGFVHLDKKYYRLNQKHLGFTPIRVDKEAKTIENGKTFYVDASLPYQEGKTLLIQNLIEDINLK